MRTFCDAIKYDFSYHEFHVQNSGVRGPYSVFWQIHKTLKSTQVSMQDRTILGKKY